MEINNGSTTFKIDPKALELKEILIKLCFSQDLYGSCKKTPRKL